MFRELRRKKQALSPEECAAILCESAAGVLAVAGDDDYPYAVPLNHLYDGSKLYFHCAKSGHKLDAIRRSDKVSYAVIHQDQIVPEEFTTYFKSVIAFGRMRILEDDREKWAVMEKLAARFSPNETAESQRQAIERDWKPLCVLEMTIEHLSGKESIELVQQRWPLKEGAQTL